MSFRSGWLMFWQSASGVYGTSHWFGFIAASLVSAAAYEALRVVVVYLATGQVP